MATKGNALGDYLRARRGQVRPEDVGLIAGARRRVRGLRREELATLAGISSEYYLRLEQGRDQNPSAQILDAIARALQLDIKGTEYLHQLASPPGARREQVDLETTADGTDELIDQFSMPGCAALMIFAVSDMTFFFSIWRFLFACTNDLRMLANASGAN